MATKKDKTGHEASMAALTTKRSFELAGEDSYEALKDVDCLQIHSHKTLTISADCNVNNSKIFMATAQNIRFEDEAILAADVVILSAENSLRGEGSIHCKLLIILAESVDITEILLVMGTEANAILIANNVSCLEGQQAIHALGKVDIVDIDDDDEDTSPTVQLVCDEECTSFLNNIHGALKALFADQNMPLQLCRALGQEYEVQSFAEIQCNLASLDPYLNAKEGGGFGLAFIASTKKPTATIHSANYVPFKKGGNAALLQEFTEKFEVFSFTDAE